MPGRFPGQIPPFEKGEWDKKQRRDLADLVLKIWASLGGLQGDPGTPTEIQAGVDSAAGDSQAAATSNHSHGIDTAAPANYVALNGAPAEGTGTPMMRADALNVLEPPTADGDVIYAEGGEWVSKSLPDALADNDVLVWMNL
jgi:hypothetical protein